MSRGDPGPYIEMDGPLIWVPRTVPWRDARSVAASGAMLYGDQRLRYVGKDEADLLGFSRDCLCEEVCEAAYVDDEPTGEHPCRVPSWKFEIVEP